MGGAGEARRHAPGLPPFDEEYLEWVDLLEAVVEARTTFTMLELGAGWGRWLVRGALAARRLGLGYRLVGVEAEPTHFEWMRTHLEDNAIDLARARLVRAAVADRDGRRPFFTGHAADCYGQRTVRTLGDRFSWRRRGGRTARVAAVSLATLLRDLDRADLVDTDVQGEEAAVFEAAAGVVDAKVRRVHVGTHSRRNESRLRTLFADLEWTCVNDYGCFSERETPWGRIAFQDGVQSWLNPRLAPPEP